MRFSTSGSLRRVDVTLAASVVDALRGEWAALGFGPGGAAVNPQTGEPHPDLVLVDGQHRLPGARYEVVTRAPVFEPDRENLRVLDAEMLGQGKVDWNTYFDRREAISVRTGTTESTTTLTLTVDDSQRLGFSVTDPAGLWSVDVAVVHGRLPRVAVSGRHDATAMIAAEGVPGCLSRVLGGIATGSASVDLAAVDRRGRSTVAEATGQFNRFRARGSVAVKTSARAWDVTANARVRAKGIARPVLWFFCGRLRETFAESAASFWSRAPETMVELERILREVGRLAEREGSIGQVVHRVLWEGGYAELVGDEFRGR